MKNLEKWDVHHHILPDFYVEELKNLGVEIPGIDWPKWTPEHSLKMMKRFGITKAFLSLSSPGVYYKDEVYSRDLTRRCNEYIASLKKQYPDKFGAFATLPLPDVEGSLKELEYALDVLKLDGVVVLTNVNGHYLGDETYRPVFEELNKRNATVFIHVNTRVEMLDLKLLSPFYWWFIDTTKTLMDIVKSGYHRDFPNIKYIPAHGAGVLPAVYSQIVESMKEENPNIKAEMEAFKQQLYPDTAKTANEYALPGLLNFTDSEHIVFGSDYMWAKTSNIAHWVDVLDKADIKESLLEKIYMQNGKALMEKKANKSGEKINFQDIDLSHQNTGSTKYHYHCLPGEAVSKLKAAGIEVDSSTVWDEAKAIVDMSVNSWKKLMLSFSASGVWKLDEKQIKDVLSAYNDAVAKIAAGAPRLGAFGAIDASQPQFAAKEIDRCVNSLKMDGVCLYIDIVDTPADRTLAPELLEKLREVDAPIMIHPKHSDAKLIEDDRYLDATYFMAKIFYSNEIDGLEDKQFVFTHTAGVLKYLTENIGLYYYMQYKKWRIGKLSYDFIVKKKLKGTALIESAIIDD